MPPKARITKEMIIDAAYGIARERGAEYINARSVSERLDCSTQPVMYHFKKIEDIRKAAYEKADEYHSERLMDIQNENPMLGIGLNYIRFAAEEKNLFRFLFQSDSFGGQSMTEVTENEAVMPVIGILSQAAELSVEQASRVFRSLFLYVHGYASMLANNSMNYDEYAVQADLELIFDGLIAVVKKENENEQNI